MKKTFTKLIWETMRLSVIVVSIVMMTFGVLKAEKSWGQMLKDRKVSINIESGSLESAIRRIETTSKIGFAYDYDLLKNIKVAPHRFFNESLDQILDALLSSNGLTFSVKNNTILIVKAPKENNKVTGFIKGRVVENSSDGTPIPGVTVRIDGSSMASSTDADGNYKLSLSPGKYRLVFSFVGFDTRVVDNVVVEDGKVREINISMKPSIAYLQEAVVVGYGVQEKRNLTGAIGTYKPLEEVGKVPMTIDNALIGKIAGVQVAPSSGIPGSASAIIIRGVSTLNKNGNTPLVVVDGVPVYSIDRNNNTTDFSGAKAPQFTFGGTGVNENYKNGAESSFENNPLASINPDDIESIEVLKDAYATAIYGSRGAAGVILITTKKGKSGKMKVDFSLSSSVSDPVKTPSMMDGDQYAEFYTSYLKAKNPASTVVFPKGISTNWLDQVTRIALGTNAALAISGGSDNMIYSISGGFDNQQSYIVNNDFSRYQGRVNLEGNLSKSIKIGTNIGMSYVDNNALNTQRIYRNAVLRAPNTPIMDGQGKYVWRYGSNPQGVNEDTNPVAWANTGKNSRIDTRVLGNIYADIKFASWVTWHTDFGVDWIDGKAYSREADKISTREGMAVSTTNNNRRWVISNELRINKVLNYKHAFNATLGQSFESSVEGINSVVGEGFQSDDILSINAATTKKVTNSLDQKWALVSYFGRLNYQFNNRYLAGVTYRLDGSSKFGKNHRYVGFPSFSLGWIPSEETFMKDVNWIDQLKFRGSLGFTGNDGGTGYYGNQGTYKPSSYSATYGTLSPLEVTSPNNPNLEWETTTMIDVGMDLTLLRSRVTLGVDYYKKDTRNSIVSSPLPSFMGFSNQQQNLADLTNKGWELTVNSQNIQGKKFGWFTTFNISRNSNTINKLHAIDPEQNARDIELNGGRYWMPGASATSFYMYEWGGVNSETGNPAWIDKDGNKGDKPIPVAYTTNPNSQRKVLGDALPKFFGGLGNTFIYKGFELNAFLSFSYGNKLFNGAKASMMNYTEGTMTGINAVNLSTDMLAYWKNAGDQTEIPSLVNPSNNVGGFGSSTDYTQGRYTSRFLEDASYIKLRSLTLAYTLKKKWASNLYRVKVFVEGNNLFTITKYTGLDPEVSAFGSSALNTGYDELTLPPMRTFRLGLQVGL
ncbi:TonB-dependent receptor [Solitalea canadensis]|nr:TonB-dependent receptor [Solitalea canadensis]